MKQQARDDAWSNRKQKQKQKTDLFLHGLWPAGDQGPDRRAAGAGAGAGEQRRGKRGGSGGKRIWSARAGAAASKDCKCQPIPAWRAEKSRGARWCSKSPGGRGQAESRDAAAASSSSHHRATRRTASGCASGLARLHRAALQPVPAFSSIVRHAPRPLLNNIFFLSFFLSFLPSFFFSFYI
jgi:hypothetical protein